MSPINRLRGYSVTVVTAAAVLISGCGSGDSGGTIGVNPGNGGQAGDSSGSSGGKPHTGGSTGSGTGGKSGGGAGGATSGGGAAGGGVDAGSGGESPDASASGGSAGAGDGGTNGGGTAGTGSGGTNGGGTAGTGSGGAGTGGATSTLCSGVTCDSAATCTGTPKKCVCPASYTDKNGNGTVCLAPNGTTCGADADCANSHCVGGSCCAVACGSPGTCEQASGTVCVNGTTCQYGKKLDNSACEDGNLCTINSCFDGACAVDSTKNCDDGDICTTDSCDPATGGCLHTALVCNDQNPCTTDSCDPSAGCQFKPNAIACDDGNKCTTNDTCSGGSCQGTAKSCANLTTGCATGVCNAATGACQANPKNNNGACTDGLDACDATGTCAAGVCVAGNDACGPIATSCATCASGVNCFGAPTGRLCTCPATSGGTPVVLQNGQCVLNTDECAAKPCGALATSCKDPTPGATPSGDYVCTCPAGTTGNKTGSPCVDLDECAAGDPCGITGAIARATKCTNLTPAQGRYSCTCISPTFTSVPTIAPTASLPAGAAPKCVCDMRGTFAETDITMVKWSGVGGGVITDSPAAGVPTYGWALRQQTAAADGTITVTSVPCGGVAPTLCDGTNNVAYAQFQPVSSWGLPKMRSGMVPIGPVSLVNAIPTTGSYIEPVTPAILGLDLKDPAGAWPPCRACVGPAVTSCTCGGTNYNITNTATWWSNAEGTNKLGVTTLAVAAGGERIGDGILPDPPINYASGSECPRTAGGSPFAAWPGYTPLFNFFSTNQWYGASRVITGRTSTSITVDAAANACVISGNVIGPAAGNKPQSDARVAGCQKANPSGACSETGPDEVGFYDNVTQSQQIVSSTFVIRKAPPSINLATLLAMPQNQAKTDAINAACETVRLNACPPSQAYNTIAGKTCQ